MAEILQAIHIDDNIRFQVIIKSDSLITHSKMTDLLDHQKAEIKAHLKSQNLEDAITVLLLYFAQQPPK